MTAACLPSISRKKAFRTSSWDDVPYRFRFLAGIGLVTKARDAPRLLRGQDIVHTRSADPFAHGWCRRRVYGPCFLVFAGRQGLHGDAQRSGGEA
jgi:hypothetical protein